MLVCGCGRWMHTEGVDECPREREAGSWLVRSECGGCGFEVGVEAPAADALPFVDRLVWSDDARHVLDRTPPYARALYQQEIEDFARGAGERVITRETLARARHGGGPAWDPEAEQRLQNVPAPVRAMAKLELERTAAEKGMSRVTVALMEEVKARYFGLSAMR